LRLGLEAKNLGPTYFRGFEMACQSCAERAKILAKTKQALSTGDIKTAISNAQQIASSFKTDAQRVFKTGARIFNFR
jgi:hypothetical protein